MSPELKATLSALRKAARALPREKPGTWKFAADGHHFLSGWCYRFSEAIYWLHPELGFKPGKIWKKDLPEDCIWLSHYYLIAPDGTVFDPTAKQFSESVDYTKGRRSRFGHKPTKHTLEFIQRANLKVNA